MSLDRCSATCRSTESLPAGANLGAAEPGAQCAAALIFWRIGSVMSRSLASSYAGANRIRFDGTLSASTHSRQGTPDELP
jgi:hypothetical protein